MPTKYVRFRDLKPRYGIDFCRVHLKRLIVAGEFPPPVELGPNTKAWEEEDILAYQAHKRAERNAKHSAWRDANPAAGADDGRSAEASPVEYPIASRPRGRPPARRTQNETRDAGAVPTMTAAGARR